MDRFMFGSGSDCRIGEDGPLRAAGDLKEWSTVLHGIFLHINLLELFGCKAQLKGVMRSTSEMLLDAKSVIRKIEFLGHRKLPYRMKHQEAYHYEGSYENYL